MKKIILTLAAVVLSAGLISAQDMSQATETAKNANVPFVACSWGFVPREKLVEAGVSRIIDHPAELALDVYIQQVILTQILVRHQNFAGMNMMLLPVES